MSMSYIKPVFYLLKVNILDLNNNDSELRKTKFLKYFTAKHQDPTTEDALLDMASRVDPRFKTQYTDSNKTKAIPELLLTVQHSS